jgi:hypothetical protein
MTALLGYTSVLFDLIGDDGALREGMRLGHPESRHSTVFALFARRSSMFQGIP